MWSSCKNAITIWLSEFNTQILLGRIKYQGNHIKYCSTVEFLEGRFLDKSSGGCSPRGWPLCIGTSGVVIHLSTLDPSVVRNRDCYLSLRTRSLPGLEVALTWRKNHELHSHTIAAFRNPLNSLDDIMCSNISSVSDLEMSSYDDFDGTELPELLQNLLVSVEHAIERIPLDDLSFPCPECLDYMPLDNSEDSKTVCACQCSCKNLLTPAVAKKEISLQTSPMFEFAGSIPHIDSDPEDDKESIRSDLVCPKQFSSNSKCIHGLE
ncbi:hypothetical protein WA026_021459 [Henosepilachna vigintioctopunctata]|uniref:Uncharacterized protein n=1 Tax=Henosepilachna vigintioctopunctata TaxID=420089 RepID=A0AAW1UIB5_9CUCU